MSDLLDFSFDWAMTLRHLLELVVAYLFAIPIAWDRETKARTAGLRTFPLVAVAACAYMIIGFQILDSTDAEARVIQGLMTGMGFIGGGAILKQGGTVQGTATAASLWATGALGLAVASHRFEIALLISAATFFTLRFLKPIAASQDEDVSDD